MSIALIESALMIAGLLATAALLWRMFHEKLRGYNSLELYLIWNFAGAIPLFFINRLTRLYTYVYVALTAVQWVINVLVTLELVSLITARYPGIRSATRIAVNVALVAAGVIALLSAMIDFGPNASTADKLTTFLLVDRTVQVSNLGFLCVVLAFLFWFPIRLSRNVLYYAIGFVLFFATRISALVLGNMFGPSTYQRLSVIDNSVFLAVVCYWAMRMTASNEVSQTVVGHAWNLREENRLIGQLDSINATLVRGSTKRQPR